MKALADALVYVITTIDTAPRDRPEQLDDDVKMLESLVAFLHEATDPELDALAAAAERALAAERAAEWSSQQLIDSYSLFMENLLEGWQGNRRVAS